jgi:hypothetical protein
MLLFAGIATAQRTVAPKSVLVGSVADTSGRPIPYATVFVDDGRETAISSDSGVFRLPLMTAGPRSFGVRRVGYQPAFFELTMPADTTVQLSIKLIPVVQLLKEVTVEEKLQHMYLARTGFYERMKAGWGTYLLPEQIDRRHPFDITDMLRGVNGVDVQSSQGNTFALGRYGGRFCVLSVYLDGVPFRLGPEGLRAIDPSFIRAIEVYPRASSAPMRFQRAGGGGCGSLVLWTKVD